MLAGGVILAIAQPGDLGGTETTAGRTTTTQPTATNATGSTTATTTGTTTGATVSGQQTTPSTAAGAATTTTTTAPRTTTTTAGGLGQSGAANAGGTQHPVTGGTSMLALGFGLVAAAFALKRASGAAARA